MPEYLTIQVDTNGVGDGFADVKKQVIVHFLTRTRGNVHQAAGLMGLPQPSLRRMIRSYDLDRLLSNLRGRCPNRLQGRNRPDEMDFNSDAAHLPEPMGTT